MADTGKRRYDPDRRDRIIEATLEVIAIHGVSGTTHRRVAEVADVPLGSMTYHFSGIEDLIEEAFSRLTKEIARGYDEALRKAETIDQARDVVVDIICGGFILNDRNTTLALELYAYTARKPEAKALMTDWMAESRKALERHFTSDVAIAVDAMIEGIAIHNYMSADLVSRDVIKAIVGKLTA